MVFLAEGDAGRPRLFRRWAADTLPVALHDGEAQDGADAQWTERLFRFFNGEKLFYTRGDNWFLAPIADLKTDAPDAPQGKPVNNGGMMATIDPRAEWRQMYRETWHIERDFFYDPQSARSGPPEDRSEVQALSRWASLARRIHLSLQRDAGRDPGRPHVRVAARRNQKTHPSPGLLGADYTVDNNRYRFAKI